MPPSPDTDTSPVSGRDGGPASSWTRSQGRGCARPASEGSLDLSPLTLDGLSPDTDTSPVSGRDGGPASSWTRSQGRGGARPASEGSLDESPSRPDGITADDDEVALILPEKAGFDRIALETLDRIPALPGAVAWWQSGAAEPPVGVYAFSTLVGGSGASPKLEVPFRRRSAVGGSEERPASEAIRSIQAMRLTCGGMSLSLSLAVVRGVLDWQALPAPAPVPGRPRRGAIPVVDGRRLLGSASPDNELPPVSGRDCRSAPPCARPASGSGLWLGLGPPGQVRAVLVVDGVAPEDPHPESPWLEPPCLPMGAAALIEAVRWDAGLMTWVLRLCPGLAFSLWPMAAKKAAASAIIGWLPNDPYSSSVASAPVLSRPSEMI